MQNTVTSASLLLAVSLLSCGPSPSQEVVCFAPPPRTGTQLSFNGQTYVGGSTWRMETIDAAAPQDWLSITATSEAAPRGLRLTVPLNMIGSWSDKQLSIHYDYESYSDAREFGVAFTDDMERYLVSAVDLVASPTTFTGTITLYRDDAEVLAPVFLEAKKSVLVIEASPDSLECGALRTVSTQQNGVSVREPTFDPACASRFQPQE